MSRLKCLFNFRFGNGKGSRHGKRDNHYADARDYQPPQYSHRSRSPITAPSNRGNPDRTRAVSPSLSPSPTPNVGKLLTEGTLGTSMLGPRLPS